ncbi:MAG: imidazole glycerol phosphate synthase subunit HisF [bacterium]|nr:imidazole glycerol phosphate synthase subunit HisF [bacterium]
MATVRIVPCLDVRDGRVVKGVRFQDLRDAGDPAQQAAAYAAQGADEVVLLDVTATLEDRGARVRTVDAVRRGLDVPLTVGGGITCRDQARAMLGAGADKVAVNSAAVRRPALLGELAAEFGRQCVVLAIDAQADGRGGWTVTTRSGRQPEALQVSAWAREGARLGAGEILLTSWDRDGTGTGYDLELVAAVRAAVDVPIVASGGGATPAHMAAAVAAGADAVLAASIFHDGVWDVRELKLELAARGVEVRP